MRIVGEEVTGDCEGPERGVEEGGNDGRAEVRGNPVGLGVVGRGDGTSLGWDAVGKNLNIPVSVHHQKNKT